MHVSSTGPRSRLFFLLMSYFLFFKKKHSSLVKKKLFRWSHGHLMSAIIYANKQPFRWLNFKLNGINIRLNRNNLLACSIYTGLNGINGHTGQQHLKYTMEHVNNIIETLQNTLYMDHECFWEKIEYTTKHSNYTIPIRMYKK